MTRTDEYCREAGRDRMAESVAGCAQTVAAGPYAGTGAGVSAVGVRRAAGAAGSAVSRVRRQCRAGGLLCCVLLLLWAVVAVVRPASAATAGLAGALPATVGGDAAGTSISGDAWSVGPGLATAGNQVLGMQQVVQAAQAICTQLASFNAALQTRAGGSSSAQTTMLQGVTKELVAALERHAATLSSDLEALQHNPLNEDAHCADMAAALAGTGQLASRVQLDKVQEETLDETRRDAATKNFPQAQGQQDVILLDSDLFKDEQVFRPGWLMPADGLITEQARANYMIGVLSNPTPAPRISDEAARTPGGRRGASALKIKSAQSGIAEGALRFVSQFYLPLTDYSLAVPELEEEAGVAEKDRMTPDETGYSLMQYFAARQQYFSGNINALRTSVLWNSSDTLRNLYILLAEHYHLRLESLRASLYQTALLATLVGARTSDQNEVVARFLVPRRQPAAADAAQ